ncbi:PatU [Calothrix rhizosoleniae]|uniref:PatU n=1 Tax=Calothrix rhizosoleniae TaxID=888997 RepID=UPI000B4A5193|nr:PatU [Calothrix rhizosoleniae]
MNSDSESLQYQLLNMLLADVADNSENIGLESKEIKRVDNNHLETAAKQMVGDFESVQTPETFQLGDIPTVQERFQAVLKRRLQIQVENHPPLFPWESQLQEYPDCVDNPSLNIVPAWGWTAQQYKLNLPTSIPEKVFQELLAKCQGLLASSLPLGAKLVQAVESLFPDNSQDLNNLAGLVLRSTSSRSPESLTMIANGESDYSQLQPRQQMALSLLAAKQLLENLKLNVSATNPVVQRQWLTSVGELSVQVELQFQGQQTKLVVQTELPAKGLVKLQGPDAHAMAQSDNPGLLSMELSCTQNKQDYTLAIEIEGIEQQALLFVITPTI